MHRLVAFAGLAVLAVIGGCLAAPPSVAHDLAHLALVALTIGVTLVMAALAHRAWRHQRLANGLARLAYRGSLAGQAVEIVPGLRTPLVAGLWRPRIFCGDALAESLDREELRGVILHEQHHQRDRAPLRLLFVEALAALVDRTFRGRAWAERERARIEIAADAHALARGVTRPTLARALLKLAAAPGSALAPGFATAGDLRLRALLGEPTGLELDRRRARSAAASAFVVIACLVVYLA